ncbi:MAG: hypothetical protein LUF85_04100 [Bacteroides sp.]|nr:hypothetical protein [Bacteroides sp.]
MKKYMISAIGLLLLLSGMLIRCNRQLREEVKRQDRNLSVWMTEAKNYRFRDSLHIHSVAALELRIAELKKYREEDAQLIRELRMRPRDVEYITRTETVVRDSLIYVLQPDSCFYYTDRWLTVDACLRDSSMYIESRDSLVQIIHKEYKHRFLWWRWGLKGVRQEIANFNPNAAITYSEFLHVRK